MMKTKVTDPVHQLIRLLIILAYPGRTDAVVRVSLSRITPIIHTEFYVECVIKLVSTDIDSLKKEHVILSRPDLKCQVDGWHHCDKHISKPTDGSCGCYYKKPSASGGFKYSFFWYIAEVTENIIGDLYTCQLGSHSDDRQMEVVTFSRRPKNPLHACQNRPIVLDWEFNPARETIVNNFQVFQVTWRSIKHDQSTLRLGVYRRDTSSGKKQFNNQGNIGSQIKTNASILPQLVLERFIGFDNVQLIQINVTFRINATTSKARRSTDEYSHGKHLSKRQTSRIRQTGNVTISKKPMTIITVAPPTTTPTGANRTTTPIGARNTTNAKPTITAPTGETTITLPTLPTIITSLGVGHFITTTGKGITTSPLSWSPKNTANTLIGTTELIIAEPPSKETEVGVRIYESITGNLVITCQINHMTNSGYPPINLTIERDGKLLVTRSGIRSLQYSTDATGDIITCGLAGKSLKCLDTNDPRLKKAITSIKDDLETISKPNNNIDPYLALYTCESITCIMLMLWALSLCLDHVNFIVKRKKSQVNKEHDEYVQRKSEKQLQLLREIKSKKARRLPFRERRNQKKNELDKVTETEVVSNVSQVSTVISKVTTETSHSTTNATSV